MALQRLTPLSGVVFVVLGLIAVIAVGGDSPDTDDPAAEVAAFYADHTGRQAAAAFLLAIAVPFVIFFAAGIAARTRDAAGDVPAWRYVLVGGRSSSRARCSSPAPAPSGPRTPRTTTPRPRRSRPSTSSAPTPGSHSTRPDHAARGRRVHPARRVGRATLAGVGGAGAGHPALHPVRGLHRAAGHAGLDPGGERRRSSRGPARPGRSRPRRSPPRSARCDDAPDRARARARRVLGCGLDGGPRRPRARAGPERWGARTSSAWRRPGTCWASPTRSSTTSSGPTAATSAGRAAPRRAVRRLPRHPPRASAARRGGPPAGSAVPSGSSRPRRATAPSGVICCCRWPTAARRRATTRPRGGPPPRPSSWRRGSASRTSSRSPCSRRDGT